MILAFSFAVFAQKENFLLVNTHFFRFDEIFDDFGKLSLNDQKARLDVLFTTIANDKTLKSLIAFRLNKNESRLRKIKRFKAISKHFDYRKVDKSRFILAFIEAEEEQTIIWVHPQEVNPKDLLSSEAGNYKLFKAEELEQKIQELFPKN